MLTTSSLNNVTASLGSTTSQNYSEFERDGELIFHNSASVWNDLRVSIDSFRRTSNSGPQWSIFKNSSSGDSSGLDPAVEFDGVDQYALVPDYSAINENTNGNLTIEFWLKPQAQRRATYFAKENAYSLRRNRSFFFFEFYGSSTRFNGITNNTWNHFVASIEKQNASTSNLAIYVNSTNVISESIEAVFLPNTNDLYFACKENLRQFYDGWMNDIVIYNKSLTAAQVSERYNSNSGSKNYPTGITAATDVDLYYKIDQNSGDLWLNTSGTRGESYDATLNNSPSWGVGNILTSSGEVSTFGVATLTFLSGTMNEVYFSVQLPHDYKLNTVLKPHVHWIWNSDISGEVKWYLEYTFTEIGHTFSDTQILYTKNVIGTGSSPSSDYHVLSEFDDISGVSNISSMMLCRLYRDTESGSGDTYSGSAQLLEFDLHYEIDSYGSRYTYTK